GDGRYVHISDYSVNSNRTYEAKVNNTIKVVSQDVMVNNVYNFQTSLFSIYLKDCNGNGLVSNQIKYGYNANLPASGVPHSSYFWIGGQTDANGLSSMEAFPGTFSIEMTKNNSNQVQADVPFTGTESYTWTTTNVKFHYKGTSNIAYGGAGTSAFFPNSGGVYEAEMLPSTVNFSFRENGENIRAITIPASTQGGCNNYEKSIVICRLVNSSNAPLADGHINYYSGGWYYNLDSTRVNGNAVLMLNGNPTTTTVQMNYLGNIEQKNNVNIASVNHVINWQTKLVTLNLVDTSNNPLESSDVQFYASGWKPFGGGSTSGGSVSTQLLGGSTYSFAMVLNGTRQQFNGVNVNTTPNTTFYAKKVSIHNIGTDCNPAVGKLASYYANGWRAMGNTDANGYSNVIDMLPGGSYSFKVGTAPQQNGVSISNDNAQVIEFDQCVNVPIRIINTEDQPFSFYPNPATTELVIGVTVDNSTVSVLSMDGRVLHSQTYNAGTSTINIASYAVGNYILRVQSGDKVETFKFIKQ
ncbi:MAG TPA: T9SS type A sorting domain-containing protein, partial [Flavipsychrobacter sp.]|nr:T9SS type A sorting domain-containing protein [Flavipsychrobacter sp.]